MGTAERREREKQQRYDMILDAAEEVITEKGLFNFTMDDIAEKAELAKGTVYLYFKSKEMLYFGLDLRGSLIQKGQFEEAFHEHKNGLSRILAIGRAYINHAFRYPLYFRAKTQTGRIDPEIIATYQNEPIAQQYQQTLYAIQKILVEALISGMQDGSIRKDIDPIRTAILLWSQSNGVIEVIMNRGEVFKKHQGIDPQELIEEFLKNIKTSLKSMDE